MTRRPIYRKTFFPERVYVSMEQEMFDKLETLSDEHCLSLAELSRKAIAAGLPAVVRHLERESVGANSA